MNEIMKKRKWAYIQKPQEYEITCNLCGGNNIDWSEYEHMIWCYDCKKDTPGTGGVFDGPIPFHAAQCLGLNFKRYYFKENEIRKPKLVRGKIEYVKD